MNRGSVSGRESDRVDRVLAALADERRRLFLQYLRESDGVASFDDVAAYVSSHSSVSESHESVSVYLAHVGIPKLREAELVEYDRNRNRVRYTADPLVERALDSVGVKTETAGGSRR